MDRGVAVVIAWVVALAAYTGIAGCHSGAESPQIPVTESQTAAGPPSSLLQDAGFPRTLPQDSLKPGERLDVNGYLISVPRVAKIINSASVFVRGSYHEASSPSGVSDNLDAAHMTSGAAGGGESSWAYWRLPMAGEQPGVYCADVNLLPRSDGTQSSYYLGIANYGAGHWDLQGPFATNHVRISTATEVVGGADYLSSLGNVYICAFAFDGAVLDVVGVAANAYDAANTTSPPAPGGPAVTAVAGGLELSWNTVSVFDLAGYWVYYSNSWFIDASTAGVRRIEQLESKPAHLLFSFGAPTYVRVSALDTSGNESPLSTFVSAAPIAGTAPDVRLATSVPSAAVTAPVTLTATGADTYDWDLDGDGSFEVTGDATGTQAAITGAPGMKRPRVRGSTGGGSSVAYADVSILIRNYVPPSADLQADVFSGAIPLTVHFDASGSTDPDGTIVDYEWDLNGNSVFNETGDESANQGSATAQYIYSIGGPVSATVRVTDDDGVSDIASVGITALGWTTVLVDTDGSVGQHPSLAVVDGNPAVSYYSITAADLRYARSTTWTGASEADWSQKVTVDSADDVGRGTSLAVVVGNPAIAYKKTTGLSIRYARSTTSTGADAADWSQVSTVGATDIYCASPSLAVVGGVPMISYGGGGSSDYLMYVESSTATGASPFDWSSEVQLDTRYSTGAYTCIADVEGRMAIAFTDSYWGDLCYAEMTTDMGWWGSTLDFDIALLGIDLVIGDGFKGISFADWDSYSLRYVANTTGDVGTWGWWRTVDDSVTVGEMTSMAIINGYPAISYFDDTNNRLKFARASNAVGTSWNTPVVVDSSSGEVGLTSSICEVAGRAGIAYENATTHELWYAVGYQ